MAPKASDIRVSVPARPDFVHVLRAVIAGVGARLDFPVDAIDDLRIAVDEACAMLLSDTGSAHVMFLVISPSREGLVLQVCTDGDVAEWPGSGVEGSLTWQVLRALADEVVYERWEENPSVRLTKRHGQPAPVEAVQ